MNCNSVIKKAVFPGTSLAVILFISSKLVLACQSVVCSNGLTSDICSIENNRIAAQRYFYQTIIAFVIVTLLFFVRKRKSSFVVAICFFAAFAPTVFPYLRGNESCDFSATEFAMWAYYVSLLCLTYQAVAWVLQLKKIRID
jgi:hypothetical protein